MASGALTRKQFLSTVLTLAAANALPAGLLAQDETDEITLDDLKAAEKVAGIKFTDDERKQLLSSVNNSRKSYVAMRALPIDYQVEPPTVFTPTPHITQQRKIALKTSEVRDLRKPTKDEDIAFLSVRELGHLLRTKQLSPVELARIYIERLKSYGDKLLCVVTLTEDLAMKQAAKAESEIAQGRYLGPLHGIPYGIKDLFATKGVPTTWGSEPHKNQVFDYDAAVVEKLRDAGAILVAKLSLGALAQGDVWFRGRTKNPWNPAQGSSGSSAGSSAATAAGLVAFAIGTETLGSIMSPSHLCRVTGLRPTYGRVSRYGAMAVSWTMDKIGPICREAEDCAIVFSAITGADSRDASSVDMPFAWDPRINLSKLKMGYLVGANADPNDKSRLEKDDYLATLVKLGAKLEPIKFDPMPAGISNVLGVEAAAAFDAFTRSEDIQKLKDSAWPDTYRSNRYVPAVEYLQAQRARTLLLHSFEKQFGDFDLIVVADRGGQLLTITNYTGHPQILVPLSPTDRNASRSMSLIGRYWQESKILAVAHQFQQAAGFRKVRPNLETLR